ncbi:MAG: hypothetical protein JOZ86_16935 [Candidatus Eremiobacteraeota bacterium]|nr:hypothetical protein [Candidatus Eremiobacteraeota bacterium]
MFVWKALASACGLVLVSVVMPLAVLAQSPAPAPAAKLVLLPYEYPGSTDPHASAVSQALAADLAAAGLPVTTIAPVDHLEAAGNAAKICADNGATGILVAEGRYEQTRKVIPAPFVTILRYPTHVDLRLDEVGCDGAVRWSTTTSGDQAPAGAFSVGNLGAAVDAAFRTAVQAAATARAAASVSEAAPAPEAIASASPPPAAAPSTYVVVPFEQPGIADPRAPDVTHSLLAQLQQHKIDAKPGTPIDHLSTIAGAQQLCAANGAQAIIVPDVRVEQSAVTGRSHASLRLSLVSCSGVVLGHGTGEADIGQMFLGNFGAAIVGVSEKAMGPAIEQLFPVAIK